jgi:hypothetical protein
MYKAGVSPLESREGPGWDTNKVYWEQYAASRCPYARGGGESVHTEVEGT